MKQIVKRSVLVVLLGLGRMIPVAAGQTAQSARQASASCPAAGAGAATVRSLDRSATGRSGLLLSFCDGHTLSGESQASSNTRAVSLVSGDFDEDGVQDLVSGSGAGKGGTVTVYRGNVEALWPYGVESRITPPAAFFSNGKTFTVPETPDFLLAGDFDADGHWDIVTARRGSDALYLLRGNGHGNFEPAKRIALGGTVTAMVSGEINRVDGLADVIVAVNSTEGPRVMVFESPRGALSDPAETFKLPAVATALALGRFDGNGEVDLAVGAGTNLVVIHGRDRKLASDVAVRAAVASAKVTVQRVGFAIQALTGGDFTGAGAAVAALGADGQIHILEHSLAPGSLFGKALSDLNFKPTMRVAGSRESEPAMGGKVSSRMAARIRALQASAKADAAEWTERSVVAMPSGFSQTAPRLVAARMTGSALEDILVPDAGGRRVHVVSTVDATRGGVAALDRAAKPQTRMPMHVLASLAATGSPTAVLPMRLNQHGLSGLVIQVDGQGEPTLMPRDVPPDNVFTVTNTSDMVIPVGAQFTGPDGSLRKAIYDASEADGTSSIVFNIPKTDPGYNAATGSFLIQPLSEAAPGAMNYFALNPINGTVTIDGYTQPGASPNTLANGDNAKILIQIDGGKATTPGGTGLSPFDDSGSTYRGLAFTGWTSGYVQNGTESGAEGIDASGIADYIEGNFFGTDTTGKASAANRIGIFADNGPGFGNIEPGNIIGGTTPQARNILSGNQLAGILFLSTAIEAQLRGNFIGLDSSGTTALSNGSDGAGMNGPTVTMGGTLPGDGNVIAGNPTNVDINDITEGGAAKNSQVQGNLVGTDATGTASPSGGRNLGVSIVAGPQDMLIGGTTPAARNIISGNYNGVYIFDNAYYNTVQGNYIGTDITGTKAVGNTINGFDTGVDGDPLVMFGQQVSAGDTTLGGSVAGAGNLISGNGMNGVSIAGSSAGPNGQDPLQGNFVLGNLIGTDVTGKLAVPNLGSGISITSGATNNILGGSAPGSGNLIANNGSHGVFIDPGNGAAITGAGFGNNTVANTILSNKGAGVRIVTGSSNRISQNSIFGNGALGIDIDIAGENANTNCNSSTNGANNLQNTPVLTSGSGTLFITATATDPTGNTSEFSNAVGASETGNMLSLLGTFNSTPSTKYTIEFFSSTVADASGYGQGQTYLGTTLVTTDATCKAAISDPIDLTQADVAVTLTGGANFQVGPDMGLNVYTGTVTNNGPATAHNVVFTDKLPAGLTISSASCDVAFCQTPVTTTLGTCMVSGQTITCNLGAMAPGATATISIPVMATAAGSPVNTATVSATEPDPNLANNTSTPTTTVVYPSPFLDHVDPAAVLAGSPDTLLTVYGENVLSSSTVTFNGTPLAVTAVLDNQICGGPFNPQFCSAVQVVVPAALLTTASTPTVELSNPSPTYGGGDNYPSDLTFTIAAACTYAIDGDTSASVTAFFSPVEDDGTTLIPESFTVYPNVQTCPWTAVSSVPWAVVLGTYTSDSSGKESSLTVGATVHGSGGVEIAFAPNTGSTSRSGSIVVNNQTVNFTQDGGATCGYALNPASATATAAGGAGSVAITTGSSCSEFVEAEVPWITVPQASGLLVGSATANYSVAPNVGAPRTGYILIGGAALAVNQAAPTCYFTLDSSSATLPVGGGTGTIKVTASSPSCAYTATSSNGSVVSVTSGASGTGSGTVKYSVPVNTGGPQTQTITIGNATGYQVFTVTEISAFTCSFTLSPGTAEVTSQGTSNFVQITASYSFCKWTASSSDPTALAINGASSGRGSGAVYYSVAQNTTGKPRTLTLTAGCAPFTITQDAPLVSTNNPVPTITSLSPTGVTAGSGAFTLTVNGTNFISGSVVNFNGAARTTTYVSATKLTAAITAADVATAATVPVTVTSPTPGGGTSNSVSFTITAANNPAPTITTLSPTSVVAGSAAFTLTVNGTNFISGSVVNFNGAARTTTYVSATKLTAAITAADVATAATVSVTVTSPTPGGGTSNSVSFTITAANNPAPTITTLSPTSVVAGSAAFTLTVNGTNFISGSVVNFNGTPRTTTYLSATQLTIPVAATDVASAGTAPVTVTNPTPGGWTSNSVSFTITAANNPAPTITTISPTTVVAGSPGFKLTVNGTNFIATSVINFGSKAETTTFVSATQLTTSIAAGDVASPGSVSVTVTNPAPGGGTSSGVAFSITAATAPGVSLTPSSIVFPDTVAGTTSAAQTVTLTNSGTADLTISGITIAGANPVAFSETNGCAEMLAAGASCTLQVSFTPASVASFTATLSIADNAAGSPQTVTLSGKGVVAPSFSITSSTASQTVAPGGSAVYSLSVGSQNGSFSSPVTLSATGLPPGAEAVFSPASVTPGGGQATSQLTIHTAATAARVIPAPDRISRAITAAALPMFALMLVFWRRRRAFTRSGVTLCLLLATSLAGVATLAGCGGGFSLPKPSAATYTVTITGTSGSIQQSTTVQLTVE